jgi:hypothetical protein
MDKNEVVVIAASKNLAYKRRKAQQHMLQYNVTQQSQQYQQV